MPIIDQGAVFKIAPKEKGEKPDQGKLQSEIARATPALF
jgi:hypothetical protein